MATQVTALPRRSAAPPLDPMLRPTLGGATLGALSSSTGNALLDVGVGAAIGWLIAPSGQKEGYALAGGAATGLAGALGLLGVLGYRYLTRPGDK